MAIPRDIDKSSKEKEVDSLKILNVEGIISDGKTLFLKNGSNLIELEEGFVTNSVLSITSYPVDVTMLGSFERKYISGLPEIGLQLTMKFNKASYTENKNIDLGINKQIKKITNETKKYRREIQF